MRYGHTITRSIADEVQRAYMEGVHQAWREVGHQPDVRAMRACGMAAEQYADSVHDKLTIPRGGTKP